MSIGITSVGIVEERLLEAAGACLQEHLGRAVVRLPSLSEPAGAFDRGRRQYSAVAFMRALAASPAPEVARLIALTERDLCIPMLSFVFGQAQLGGRVALVSLARLRQEFYGLPAHMPFLLARLEKETIHEVGHTFGLVHCLDRSCPMALSTTLQQLDLKTNTLCPSCRIRIQEQKALVHA